MSSSPFHNDPSQILKRRIIQRNNILWLQDQITLSVYHKKPQSEIDLLLRELEDSISIAKRN